MPLSWMIVTTLPLQLSTFYGILYGASRGFRILSITNPQKAGFKRVFLPFLLVWTVWLSLAQWSEAQFSHWTVEWCNEVTVTVFGLTYCWNPKGAASDFCERWETWLCWNFVKTKKYGWQMLQPFHIFSLQSCFDRDMYMLYDAFWLRLVGCCT